MAKENIEQKLELQELDLNQEIEDILLSNKKIRDYLLSDNNSIVDKKERLKIFAITVEANKSSINLIINLSR